MNDNILHLLYLRLFLILWTLPNTILVHIRSLHCKRSCLTSDHRNYFITLRRNIKWTRWSDNFWLNSFLHQLEITTLLISIASPGSGINAAKPMGISLLSMPILRARFTLFYTFFGPQKFLFIEKILTL